MKHALQFTLNGQPLTLEVDDERMLLWVLRTELGLTDTKYGCGEAHCGACTVLVDGKALRSCRAPMRAVDGKVVVTIEGLAPPGRLDPLQQAFIDHSAVQCGYCTPGMLLTAKALLTETLTPTRALIAARLERNLCRCGAHQRIVDAVEAASKTGSLP